MPTRRQLRDELDNADRALAAASGALEAHGDTVAVGYLGEVARCLDVCRHMTTEIGGVSGVPKIEVPMEEWLEIERLCGSREESLVGRKRARSVVRMMEHGEERVRKFRERLVMLTGGDGTEKE